MINNNLEILLVDDDQDVLDAYQHLLSLSGYRCKKILDPLIALTYIKEDWPGIVITDMYMPQLNGLDLLSKIQKIDAFIPIIMITGHGDIPMAVQAVKQGACDFLEKPIEPSVLLRLITKQLKRREHHLQQKHDIAQTLHRELIGQSAQISKVRSLLSEIVILDNHLCVWGEAGTGRHNICRFLHHFSPRGKAPIINIDAKRRPKKQQLKDSLTELTQATIILNAPEYLDKDAQYWLAEYLLMQERKQNKHVRFICILNNSPEDYLAKQRLLPELYYILNQQNFSIPPLRYRPDDIVPLFHYFLKKSCHKLQKSVPKIEPSYLHTLRLHPWAGNIRELRNIAELFAIGIVKLSEKDKTLSVSDSKSPLDLLVDEYEKKRIEDALYLFSGRVSEAAEHLQIPRKKLYLRMKKHEIDKKVYKNTL
ncbi:phosphoglycerate transport system transcriptional regulatory protein PgtA [Psychromonas sp. CNPT3]|uniref:sigma-54-dependent transcriptional regulator n=1 Tax=Psychromonas sp. CNPT3 TaxID=314282 RepID=UPI00006E70BD|nr:sigma-54 dependent transcriptional regulator [Psychromonas sp. CNPT3]AGH80042.1 phosphoglycerate transport system transcriptional regulatory protein PgtA [Psychromonas sp. CNPT3]